MRDALRWLDTKLGAALATLTAGGAGVGFVGADVPVDVLVASGRPFGHLPWRSDGPTPWADRWLESSFPFSARSILEQWHEGAFDGLAAVVFSRADDASQRLFYYVRELQRRGLLGGPEPHAFDIALLPRESSLAHTTAEVLRLARLLDVEARALGAGIERTNRLRRALADLQGGRAAHGPLYERLARAALWSNPLPWLDELALPENGPPGTRVLLAGSLPPDDRLHCAVEAAGASIVAEAHVHALGRLGTAITLAGDAPERVIARHAVATSVSPRAVLDRAQWLVAGAAAARAAAVVLWLTREDEALGWQLRAQRRALAAAGIPALVLPAARWQADDGALERVTDFCKGLPHATA